MRPNEQILSIYVNEIVHSSLLRIHRFWILLKHTGCHLDTLVSQPAGIIIRMNPTRISSQSFIEELYR